MLVSRDGTEHNILKIKPPIVFDKGNVDRLVKVLREVMREEAEEDRRKGEDGK